MTGFLFWGKLSLPLNNIALKLTHTLQSIVLLASTRMHANKHTYSIDRQNKRKNKA